MTKDTIALLAIVAAVVLIKLFRGALGEAIAARIRGGAGADPALREELDAVKMRLAEVEERLDFAERVLARNDPVDRLPGKGDT